MNRPALLGQQPLPVLAVGGAARHGAQQVRVDLDHLVGVLGSCWDTSCVNTE